MGEETDQYVESTSKLRDLVKGYTGFDIMDDENNFKDLYEIVLGIGQAWGDLEDIQKAALGEALGGKRNARGLYSIFDHLDTLTSAYETSVNSAGSAAREQEHYAESVQYSIDRTKASLQELSVDFLSSDLLKGLIEGANRVLQVLDDIISRFGTIKTLLAGASIADFGRGLFTGKGIFAGVFEHLAGKSGEASASGNMLSNILTVFGSSKATKMATKAGEDVGEAVETGFKTVLKEIDIGGGEKEFAEILIPTTTGKIAGEKLGNDMAKSAPKTAKNFVSKFVGAISAHPIAAAIGGVAIAGLIAKNAYDRYKANQISTANTATDKYNDTKATIESYKSQYQTLYKQLHDANTTEAEGIEIRKQIVDLQSQITEQYGAQASGVDLVNGKLDEQLSKLDQIVSKNAQEAFADGDTKNAYKDAAKEMNRQDREYSFGFFNQQYSDEKGSLHERIQEIADEIEGVTYGDAGNGFYELKFNGNVTDAEAAIETLKNRVVELRRDFKDDDSALFEIDQLGDNLTKQGKKVSDTIGKYRDNWLSGLEQGFHEEFYGKEQDSLLADYEEANRKYNESIASEDVDAFAEAQAERQEILAKLQDTYGNDEEGRNKYKSQIEPLVSDMDTIIDKSSEFKMNVRDLVDENGNLVDKSSINNTNEFKDNIDGIKESFEGLKNLNLDEADFKEMTADIEKFGDADPAIKKLGESLGLSFDDVDTYADNINLLSLAIAEMGGFTNTASTETEEAAQKFEDFQSSIIKDIANMDTINSALVNSFSGKGLTFAIDENTNKLVGDIDTIKNVYADLADEFDLSKLFERTANGVKVNIEEQRKLQSILESRNKQKFIDEENRLLEEQARLQSRLSTMDENHSATGLFDDYKTRLSNINQDLENVRNLKAAYEGATSAYQKYLDAQNLPSEGAIYENLRDTTIKRGDELLKNGYLGQEFRSIAQLFSYEDLSSAPVEEVSAAYTKGRDAVKGFFTENADGIVKFAEQIKKLDPAEYGFVTGSAEEGYNFFGLNNDKLAEYFGVSVDIIDAMFGRFEQFGYQFTEFDAEQNATFRAIKANIDATQKSFKDLDGDLEISVGGNKKSVSDVVNFDIAEIGNDADALRTKLSELSALKGLGPQIGTENLELVDSLIQEILRNLQLIDDTKVEPGQVNLEGIEQGEREIQAFTEAFNKTEETNKKYGLELTVEGNTQAMAAVDWFMSNPELAAAMKIDVSGGKESVIEQLTELAKNGGIQTTVDADVNTGNVQEEVSSAVSGASGTPDVNVDEGNVASQTEEGIKGADGTPVTPSVDAGNVQSETEGAIESATNKTYRTKVSVDPSSIGKSIANSVKNAAAKVSLGKSTKTTNETVTKETKETDIKTNVSGNAEADLAKLQAMASAPMNVKINVDTNADVAVAKLQSIAHTPLKGKVKISVEDSEVKSWKAPEKTGMVKYFVNGGNVSAWSPPEKQGYVRYNVTGTSPVYNWKAPEKTGIVRYTGVGPANGTAHWQGTAGGYYSPKRHGSVGNSFINHYNGTAYARGNWGLKRDEPNALINELGPEIVVLCKLCYHVWRHACKITSNC